MMDEEDGAEDLTEDASFWICIIRLLAIFSTVRNVTLFLIKTRDWIGLWTFRIVTQFYKETTPFRQLNLFVRDCMSFIVAEDGTQLFQLNSFHFRR